MKHLKLILVIVVLLYATPLFSQYHFPSIDSRAAALGGASLALTGNAAPVENIAGLASLKKTVFSASIRQITISKGFGMVQASAATPLAFGSCGIEGFYYGNSQYNEARISFAYAMPIDKNIHFGTALHWLHSGTSDHYYIPQNELTFSAALQYSPSKEITVGFKAFNPIAVQLSGSEREHTPAIFSLGVACKLLDNLMAICEAEKELRYDATLRFGVEYTFLDNYALRLGFNTNPAIYTFGIGINLQSFGFNMASQIHNILGMMPHFSVHYTLL